MVILRFRRVIHLAAVPLVVGVVLSGCFASDQYTVIQIENRTDTTIDIFLVTPSGDPNGSQVLTAVEPGTAYPYSNIAEGCSDAQLVAKDDTGRVVGLSPTPLCRPSTWVIDP
jgi:hypothetical protein